MKYLLTLFSCLFFTNTFSQTKASDVVVYDEHTSVPSHCKLIGKVKILNDGYRADCGYRQIMREARERVAKQGGNVYKITKLGKPSALYPCYEVWGQAYFTDSLKAIKEKATAKNDSIIKKLISDTAKYALLYIYRPRVFEASVWNSRIHADDIELCRMKNGSTCIVKIEKEGVTEISSSLKGLNKLKLDIKFGMAYFIKIELGNWPLISAPPALQGYNEFMKVKAEE